MIKRFLYLLLLIFFLQQNVGGGSKLTAEAIAAADLAAGEGVRVKAHELLENLRQDIDNGGSSGRPRGASMTGGLSELQKQETMNVCKQIEETGDVPATVCFWPSINGPPGSNVAWKRAFLQGGFVQVCPAASFLQTDEIMPDRFPLQYCCPFRRCSIVPTLSKVTEPPELARLLSRFTDLLETADAARSATPEHTQVMDRFRVHPEQRFYPHTFDLTDGTTCLKAIQTMAHWYTQNVGPIPDQFQSSSDSTGAAGDHQQQQQQQQQPGSSSGGTIISATSPSPWMLKAVNSVSRTVQTGFRAMVSVLTVGSVADLLVKARTEGLDPVNVLKKPMAPPLHLSTDRAAVDTVRRQFDACKRTMPPQSVLQARIHPPMLVRGRKIDMRFFVYIASLEPYVVLLHEFFLTRFAPEAYDETSTDDSMHVTSWSWGRGSVGASWSLSSGGSASSGEHQVPPAEAWTPNQLRAHFKGKAAKRDPLSPPENWIDASLYPQVGAALRHTFTQLKPQLIAEIPFKQRPAYYELIGADFLVDSGFKPWLIDLHRRPFADRRRYKHSPAVDRAHRTIMRQVISMQHELLQWQATGEPVDFDELLLSTQFHSLLDDTPDIMENSNSPVTHESNQQATSSYRSEL